MQDVEAMVEAQIEDEKIAKALEIAKAQLLKAGYTEEEVEAMSEDELFRFSMEMDYKVECALEYEKE